MNLDKFSNPIFTDNDLFDIIYQGDIEQIFKLPIIKNSELELLETHAYEQLTHYTEPEFSTIAEFDSAQQNDWFMPAEYYNFDIFEYCISQCSTNEQITRVCEEFVEFENRNMIRVLQWAKYFVDTCTKNNVLWGVGRGSSVASYILFLLKVHKIDSMKYNLEWQEFLRG
jgi:DNA polymerase III alpha subunit